MFNCLFYRVYILSLCIDKVTKGVQLARKETEDLCPTRLCVWQSTAMRQRHFFSRNLQYTNPCRHTLPEWTFMNRRPPRTGSDPQLAHRHVDPTVDGQRLTPEHDLTDDLNSLHGYCILRWAPLFTTFLLGLNAWACKTSLSRWLSCKNNHYRGHTSCRVNEDVVIPPVRPAKVQKISNKYIWYCILWSPDTASQAITVLLFSKAILFIPLGFRKDGKSHILEFLFPFFFWLSSCV